MRKVLADASSGLALLTGLPGVDERRTGVLGHSYGGNTTLFQAALDERAAFAVASGALWGAATPKGQSLKERFLVAVFWQQLLGIICIVDQCPFESDTPAGHCDVFPAGIHQLLQRIFLVHRQH